ncbi:hypothetical protein [Peribacillus butanolivorans]|nr:hypothetical protein [Peribacillus butanolivorans]
MSSFGVPVTTAPFNQPQSKPALDVILHGGATGKIDFFYFF